MTVLDDLLTTNLKVVFCGSAAGAESARRGAYYAGPGNKFWKTLHVIGLTSYELKPSQYRLLSEFGIGLTDLVKDQSGSDQAINFAGDHRDHLAATILQWQPRYLCFNGKKAAQEYFRTKKMNYGLQADRIGATAIFVAPSSSGAANGAWNPAPWQELADRIGEGDDRPK